MRETPATTDRRATPDHTAPARAALAEKRLRLKLEAAAQLLRDHGWTAEPGPTAP